VAAMRSIKSLASSGPCTLTFDISQSPSPRNWVTPASQMGRRPPR
jgi:hypothetical protein